jgi:hypothetical protein
MADIDYTSSPQGHSLTTQMAGFSAPAAGAAGGGMDKVASLYEEMIRRKMLEQQQAKAAAYQRTQNPGIGSSRANLPSRQQQEDENFKRQQQQMQLKAMQMEMHNAQMDRVKANQGPEKMYMSGAGYKPGWVTIAPDGRMTGIGNERGV